jgi:hypothetical protein
MVVSINVHVFEIHSEGNLAPKSIIHYNSFVTSACLCVRVEILSKEENTSESINRRQNTLLLLLKYDISKPRDSIRYVIDTISYITSLQCTRTSAVCFSSSEFTLN